MPNQPDRHRPRCHFMPPANWMNDPNGLIHWQGTYHLFYQYNPHGAFHGTIHWGHAVSRDLVHWEDWPIALAPTPGGPDADGCWSGCAVGHDGTPTLVYTGVRPETQCLATSNDGLRTWAKHPANPVIAAPPEGLEVTGFRDPWVWREGGTWQMIVGSGFPGQGGALLLYRSPDLVSWEYVHAACVGHEAETGTMWECPNLFALGDRHVLVVSPIPLGASLYALGDYRDGRFAPESWGMLDEGGSFYAPQSMRDAAGRRLMWGWLRENRDRDAQLAAGWSGVMTLPRELQIAADGGLRIRPVAELEALRGEGGDLGAPFLTAGTERVLDLRGRCLELRLEIAPGDSRAVGLSLLRSPDGAEQTRLYYLPREGALVLDRSRSGGGTEVDRAERRATLSLAEGEPLRLTVYVDGSVIEVCADERVWLTGRVYPGRDDSQGVSLFAEGGAARVERMQGWALRPIWEDEAQRMIPEA